MIPHTLEGCGSLGGEPSPTSEECIVEGRHSLGRRNWWAGIFGLVVLLVVAGGSTVLGWIPPSSSDPGVPAAGTVVASGEPVTRTYQKGDGGSFSETDDAYISSTAPDTNFGAATELHVDGSGCHVSPATVCKALIRFPSFIGGDPAQVPTGSSVVSATLQLTITNPGTTEDLYQVTDSWGADWVTWNSFSSAGSPATRARESVFAPRPLGPIAINITSIVQQWVNLEPNDGILLASSDPDGVVYGSSESANRPLLSVQFIRPSFVGPLPTVDLGTLPGDTDSQDRKSTRLNSSRLVISYAVFCLKKKNIDSTLSDAYGQRQFSTIFTQLKPETLVLEGATVCPHSTGATTHIDVKALTISLLSYHA